MQVLVKEYPEYKSRNNLYVLPGKKRKAINKELMVQKVLGLFLVLLGILSFFLFKGEDSTAAFVITLLGVVRMFAK